jgi:hypothetical protein
MRMMRVVLMRMRTMGLSLLAVGASWRSDVGVVATVAARRRRRRRMGRAAAGQMSLMTSVRSLRGG